MAKCYSSFSAIIFLMYAMLQQCCLLVSMSGADVVVVATNSPLLGGELATDLRIFFPDEIAAKRVEYEDFIDPISGEDEDVDDESYEMEDFSTATLSATEITEEELPATNDTVISYVLFPSSVEEV